MGKKELDKKNFEAAKVYFEKSIDLDPTLAEAYINLGLSYDFLNEIREANNNFSLNSNAILFSNEFEDKYSSKVAELLDGIRYNFKKIASLSYNINSIGFDILKGKNLNVNHLSLTCEKYASYIL